MPPGSLAARLGEERATLTDLVFGYGSLAADPERVPTREPHAEGWIADLAGHRRTWGVAMDNSVAIPGYKRYLDPDTGEPPGVMVAFLDLTPSVERAVNGVLTRVEPDELRTLDRRERNYRRVEVTALIEPAPGARVWTYVGRPEARERLRAGVATARAAVAARYLEQVEEGFRRLGPGEWERYAKSTDAPACPVRTLQRIEL